MINLLSSKAPPSPKTAIAVQHQLITHWGIDTLRATRLHLLGAYANCPVQAEFSAIGNAGEALT